MIQRLGFIASVTTVGTYLVLVLLVFAYQRRLLFPAPANVKKPVLKGASVITVEAPHGKVTAFYLSAAAGHRTVVCFHGNAEQLSDDVPLAFQYGQTALGFLGVEYPGYGLDKGLTASEESLFASAEAAARAG